MLLRDVRSNLQGIIRILKNTIYTIQHFILKPMRNSFVLFIFLVFIIHVYIHTSLYVYVSMDRWIKLENGNTSNNY